MSSKKEKLIESAQKLVLKGQLDRAIKEYQQVVALDPADIRQRQRLAELLVRLNRKGDAITEYEAIGKYYSDNSYFLKAIAVYKQIQKLDPENITISLNLAVLNEKQELTGNALAEYSRIYSYYEKMGNHAEALSIVQSMLAIEPDNLNTKLKLAESRFSSGMKEQALKDFIHVAIILKEQGDIRASEQVGERIAYLYPGNNELAIRIATLQLQRGDASSALAALKEITRTERGNIAAWQMMVDAARLAGSREESKAVLQKMARLFPDELSPLEGLIQCAVDERDVDGAIYLIKTYQALFLNEGSSAILERAYLSLIELMPGNKRLIEGLQELQQKCGMDAKVPEVCEAADLPPDARDEEPQELDLDLDLSDVTDSFSEISEMTEPATAGLEEVVDTEEVPLELELAGVNIADPVEVARRGDAEKLPGEAQVDLPLELELSDEDPVEPGWPEDTGELDLADPAEQAGPETALSEELLVDFDSDDFLEDLDEYVEIEADIVTGIDDLEPISADNPGDANDAAVALQETCGQTYGEDTETHYDLGIAFKEMGMYDKAIAELCAASADPGRKVDCLTLQGVCFRDKGDFTGAEGLFRQGLALPRLSTEEHASLKYELAILYESQGRDWDALLLFREIEAVIPGFRDTKEKIAGFDGGGDDPDCLDLLEIDCEIYDA